MNNLIKRAIATNLIVVIILVVLLSIVAIFSFTKVGESAGIIKDIYNVGRFMISKGA